MEEEERPLMALPQPQDHMIGHHQTDHERDRLQRFPSVEARHLDRGEAVQPCHDFGKDRQDDRADDERDDP